jgi:hypothetical protein
LGQLYQGNLRNQSSRGTPSATGTGVNAAAAGHFASIPGGGLYPAALGDLIADIAEGHGLWFHCDAAYGGFFLLTSYGISRPSGIERSRSTP